MNKLLSFFNLSVLKTNLKNIIDRFPISIIIIFIISGFFFYLVNGELDNIGENNILRIILSSIITFFLSIGIYLLGEGNNKTKLTKNLYQILSIVFGILFYIGFDTNIDDFENFIFFILSLVGVISFLFFSPYIKDIIKSKVKKTVFYTYFYNISTIFLISFILGGLLFMLGNIGITATFTLFDISYSDYPKIIPNWAVISLSFITPIFALTKLPDKKSFNENHFNENIFFSFLIKYILVPFIFVYFIILYAYSIKVLLNFENWPKGEVTWMVIGFSILGYVTYIFSYIFEEKHKLVSIFRKIFPYVVVPQVFMLFYAIYLRINQYDITVNRYFVVVFGIWLFIISIYYIFSSKKHLYFMMSSLTFFTLIISIGPWSVYELPEKRQYNILISNLKTANILQDSSIIPLENYNSINSELSNNIYSEIEYLCDFDNCNKIKNLFSEEYNKLFEKNKEEFEKNKKDDLEYYKDDLEMIKKINDRIYNKPSKWEIVSHITQYIKVKNEYYDFSKSAILYFDIDNYNNIFPIELKGYSKMLEIYDNGKNNEIKEYIRIDVENKKIELLDNNTIVDTLDIGEFIDGLYDKYKTTGETKFTKEELTISTEKYKVILKNISIKNPEYDGEKERYYYNGSGYILIK